MSQLSGLSDSRIDAQLASPPLSSREHVQASSRAADEYGSALGRLAGRPDEALSLLINLPFCAAHCLCCARDVRAAQPQAVIDDYIEGLVDEIQRLGNRLGRGRDVLQLHLGGGSASELSTQQLLRLMGAVQQQWRLPGDAELSVECDPRRAQWAWLQLLRGLGFDRITYGVLDLCPEVQQAIGRIHTPALIDDACLQARECGYTTITLNLLIGLPRQTPTRWRATLEGVLDLLPERFSIARYRHQPQRVRVQQAIDAQELPSEAVCNEMSGLTGDVLGAAGYRRVASDLFVLETDELLLAAEQGRLRQSLIACTATPPTSLLGLGAGAPGQIEGRGFWNEASVKDWRQQLRAGRWPIARADALEQASVEYS